MLVVMSVHDAGRRADHVRRRHHHGAARGRRPVLAGAGRACRCWPVAIGLIIGRMVPQFRRDAGHASTRSTGCCASRSPASGWCGRSSASRVETARFGEANARADRRPPLRRRPAAGADLPDRHAGAQRVQRRPCSGSARSRVDAGQMQIGALTAFLSYLMQILMSVMMATFMAMMVPRAAVCAERIVEVLDTESSVAAAGRAGHRRPRRDGRARAARRRASTTRAPTRRCCATSRFTRRGRAAPPRSSAAPAPARPRCSSLVPRLFDVTGGRGAGRRRRRARARPRGAVGADRPGPAAAVPVLRHGGAATCATATRTPPTRSCGRRWRSPRPRDFVRAMPDGLRRADRAGRHQRLRRPAPAAGDRPGAGRAARRSTCSTTRSRRSTWPPTPGCARRCARSPRAPTVVIVAQRVSTHRRRRPDRRARGRRRRRHRHATTSCWRRCPTYAEIVESQLSAEAAA